MQVRVRGLASVSTRVSMGRPLQWDSRCSRSIRCVNCAAVNWLPPLPLRDLYAYMHRAYLKRGSRDTGSIYLTAYKT